MKIVFKFLLTVTVLLVMDRQVSNAQSYDLLVKNATLIDPLPGERLLSREI
jgi:hypothetical protein